MGIQKHELQNPRVHSHGPNVICLRSYTCLPPAFPSLVKVAVSEVFIRRTRSPFRCYVD